MQTIPEDEFKALIERDWDHDQNIEVFASVDIEEDTCDGDYVFRKVVGRKVHGFSSVTSTHDGIEITYNEGFDYTEYEPDTLSRSTEGLDEVWRIEGISVVDEDGDKMHIADLCDDLPAAFSDLDYSVLEIEQHTDIDVNEDSNMETHVLKIDNAPNLRFTGERIARAASSDDRAMESSYSGQTGRWTELELYKTGSGKLICYRVERTRWQGERDECFGEVCETLDEVKAFMGYGWLAKALYFKAGIDVAVDVD